ncbi:MAG: hypothetical protein BGO31_11305 [Bacteroidetes bacterium 43-16]|nr:MAG: hypothetical protein BGO31_11305 [Bacteroidetes bacterium 43-16]
MAVSVIASAFLISCDKNDKTDKKDETLQGRDAFIGSYSFTNNYEHVAYVSSNNYDTIRGVKTYTLIIEKPSPDDKGTDAVVIRSLWAEYPQTWPVVARVASDGKSLYFKFEDNDGEMNMTKFEAPLNTDKSIDLNYFRYRFQVTNMGYEKGSGKATRN